MKAFAIATVIVTGFLAAALFPALFALPVLLIGVLFIAGGLLVYPGTVRTVRGSSGDGATQVITRPASQARADAIEAGKRPVWPNEAGAFE